MNLYLISSVVFLLLSLAGLYLLFNKSGQAGWKVLIPFYNFYIWLKIIKKPWWWYIFLLTPFINVFVIMLMIVELLKCFNKHGLLEQAVGVIFPYFYLPYLGLNKDAVYVHPDNRPLVKKSAGREWLDAIIFAVIAATIIRTFLIEAYTIPTSSMEKSLLVGDFLFVSKVTYGPKIPQTPIAFPFAHHTLPLTKTTKSYVEWIKLPFYRFPGFKSIKNNDVVVFNYPSGDTVVLERQNEDYYQIVRDAEREMKAYFGDQFAEGSGRDAVWKEYHVTARPPDKRENYIKRCVGIPGDEIRIVDRQLFVNGKKAENPANMQYNYDVYTDGTALNPKSLEKLKISEGGQIEAGLYVFPLSEDKAKQLATWSNVRKVEVRNRPEGIVNLAIFPHDTAHYKWNEDNFGPLIIPRAGSTVTLTAENIALYKRIIDVYEYNDLEIRDGKILINGKETNTYTFKQDYYWMMGDNRHNSADSRFWGFVPSDHVVGSAVFVWLSLDKQHGNMPRWNKMFRVIR
ncbi:MAG TPA: S26 family signal peptidase [Bacteroidales bacterium]|nr:S26 family signal peptidase [Bacteroidales bacterium]HSA42614.1 S26 family signal peptidase [Bacteroidales bacterium]